MTTTHRTHTRHTTQASHAEWGPAQHRPDDLAGAGSDPGERPDDN